MEAPCIAVLQPFFSSLTWRSFVTSEFLSTSIKSTSWPAVTCLPWCRVQKIVALKCWLERQLCEYQICTRVSIKFHLFLQGSSNKNPFEGESNLIQIPWVIFPGIFLYQTKMHCLGVGNRIMTPVYLGSRCRFPQRFPQELVCPMPKCGCPISEFQALESVETVEDATVRTPAWEMCFFQTF